MYIEGSSSYMLVYAHTRTCIGIRVEQCERQMGGVEIITLSIRG